MSVVFQRPYRFVPPHRGDWWPTRIPLLRLNDWHLRTQESVVSHECRHGERFADSHRRGDAVFLAPNHCRYADPIVLGWLAQILLSFPDRYLLPGQVTDSRIVETIQRMQEAMFGKASDTMPLHVVIEVDEATPEKPPRKETDPILTELGSRLETTIERLSKEARAVDENVRLA